MSQSYLQVRQPEWNQFCLLHFEMLDSQIWSLLDEGIKCTKYIISIFCRNNQNRACSY